MCMCVHMCVCVCACVCVCVCVHLEQSLWSRFCASQAGYDNKDCLGQVTYSVGQVKISVACPTGQGVIKFFIDSIIFQFKH